MERVRLDRTIWLRLVATVLLAVVLVFSGDQVVVALSSGVVPCVRRCHGTDFYTLADDPALYWWVVAFRIFMLVSLGFVGAVVLLSGLRDDLTGGGPLRERRRRIDSEILHALREALPAAWSSAVLVLDWPAPGAVAPKLRILNPGSGEGLWLTNELLSRAAWRLLDLYRERGCGFRRAFYSVSRHDAAGPERSVRFEYADDQSARDAGDAPDAAAA